MSLNTEQDFAIKNAWHRLGRKEVEVMIALTDQEKIEFGKRQSEALEEIKKLESQLNDFKKEIKNKSEAHQFIIESTCELINAGKRPVMLMLPSFLDPRDNKKHYVNMETGEIMLSEDACEDDRQGTFLDKMN